MGIDIAEVRRQFKQRLRDLIGIEKNQKTNANLKNFAAKTGLFESQLSQWANAESTSWPGIKNLIKLSMATGKSLDWFLFGPDPARPVQGKTEKLIARRYAHEARTAVTASGIPESTKAIPDTRAVGETKQGYGRDTEEKPVRGIKGRRNDK